MLLKNKCILTQLMKNDPFNSLLSFSKDINTVLPEALRGDYQIVFFEARRTSNLKSPNGREARFTGKTKHRS